jgi:hypothetical protein
MITYIHLSLIQGLQFLFHSANLVNFQIGSKVSKGEHNMRSVEHENERGYNDRMNDNERVEGMMGDISFDKRMKYSYASP